MDKIHIVKRKGHSEPYNNHKVYASCYAACLNAHSTKEKAEEICGRVTNFLDHWIADKNDVSSEEIFKEITRVMNRMNKDAAFMYETHRDIS